MVHKLSYENFQKARRYLMTFGRDLEQELFRFHFENGHPEKVISLLKQYQGENGGFKNMGEGHSVIPNSMDTSMAFQYLSEVGATSKEEIVQKGIKFIIDTFDNELKCWHPRPDQLCNGWSDNPCAELAGFLYEFRELVPQDEIKDVIDTAIDSMSTIHTSKEERRFYFLEALSLHRLAVRIDEPLKSIILGQLQRDIFEIIETDSSKWTTTYCAKPFFFASSPESPMFSAINEYVIQSLANEINTQAEDGHFILNWNVDEEGAFV
ncbi:hypothetical protein [Bacillus sp. ISL-45]|uniref:hypothetical protein n=1 Tax=Bacillus sp. ISL-45 TaxID=2819128 RepID=UPI001BEBBD98|nr:hypothetical protein [Bacillus sp. ISL-45]MBT2663398.1 hypothetical protein [Bacillus sp. ISL-45]